MNSGNNGGKWGKIIDIITTEEVNNIVSMPEEFIDITKSKEFIIRIESEELENV